MRAGLNDAASAIEARPRSGGSPLPAGPDPEAAGAPAATRLPQVLAQLASATPEPSAGDLSAAHEVAARYAQSALGRVGAAAHNAAKFVLGGTNPTYAAGYSAPAVLTEMAVHQLFERHGVDTHHPGLHHAVTAAAQLVVASVGAGAMNTLATGVVSPAFDALPLTSQFREVPLDVLIPPDMVRMMNAISGGSGDRLRAQAQAMQSDVFDMASTSNKRGGVAGFAVPEVAIRVYQQLALHSRPSPLAKWLSGAITAWTTGLVVSGVESTRAMTTRVRVPSMEKLSAMHAGLQDGTVQGRGDELVQHLMATGRDVHTHYLASGETRRPWKAVSRAWAGNPLRGPTLSSSTMNVIKTMGDRAWAQGVANSLYQVAEGALPFVRPHVGQAAETGITASLYFAASSFFVHQWFGRSGTSIPQAATARSQQQWAARAGAAASDPSPPTPPAEDHVASAS